MGNSAWPVRPSSRHAARVVGAGLARPAHGAAHGFAGVLVAHRVFRAFVERHEDVASEIQLGVHGGFRREGVQIAIEVRLEHHALVGDLAQAAQAEHLVAAGIRKDGVGPGHEAVQPAEFADDRRTGPHIQVIGVGQDDACAQVFGEIAFAEPLDGSLRAHRHEDRRFDGAVGGVQEPGARPRVRALGHHFEGDFRHCGKPYHSIGLLWMYGCLPSLSRTAPAFVGHR